MNILYIGYLFTNQNNNYEKNCDFNFDGFVKL